MATISFPAVGSVPIQLPLRQFDADEYIAMAEAGAFESQSRVELIGGYVIDMSPVGPAHNYVTMRLIELFSPLASRFKLCVQGTLKIDKGNVFDPDFMLLHPRKYRDRLPNADDVALLIEVSMSSRGYDAKVKLPLYAEAGIAEYWIADIDDDMLIVHRQPQGNAYLDVQPRDWDAAVSPLAALDFSLQVRQIFE
jgi:Uma2 family endonuclease